MDDHDRAMLKMLLEQNGRLIEMVAIMLDEITSSSRVQAADADDLPEQPTHL